MVLVQQKDLYFSWIPTLSGYLDFTEFECGLGSSLSRRVCETLVTHDQTYRSIAHSTVNWKDRNDKVYKSGKFTVTLLAQHKVGSDLLDGTVYIVPKHVLDGTLKKIFRLIKRLRSLRLNKEEYLIVWEQAERLLLEESRKSLYKVHFVLDRSGFIFLDLDESNHNYDELTLSLIHI